MQQSSPFRMIATLVLVCIVAAGGLSLTYAVTKDQIAKEKKKDEAKAYMAVLPKVTNPNDFVPMDATTKEAAAKFPELIKVVKAQVADRVEGYVVVLGPRGYGGPVQMAVGLTPGGETTDVAFIANGNNETQGLGTQALAPNFTKQFAGKTAADQLEIGKDVDAITGATRSSRAVTTGAKDAVTIFKDYIGR